MNEYVYTHRNLGTFSKIADVNCELSSSRHKSPNFMCGTYVFQLEEIEVTFFQSVRQSC